jgi:hypothetical protein
MIRLRRGSCRLEELGEVILDRGVGAGEVLHVDQAKGAGIGKPVAS